MPNQSPALHLSMPHQSEPEVGIGLLCSDTLQAIFSHLDGFSLGQMSMICTHWRTSASVDELWAAPTRARWNLPVKNGRYKFGERSWREVYRVFHRRLRIPLLDGVGSRDVVYASGRQSRICCWLLLNHLPACRLVQRNGVRVVSARIAVQNLRGSPIEVDLPSAFAVTFRDGSVSRPMCSESVMISDGDSPTEILSKPARRMLRLAPNEVGLLPEVLFPVLESMHFEPDFLEAAHQLRLRASLVGTCGFLDVQCGFVPEATVWEHFELITRDFYVHLDQRD